MAIVREWTGRYRNKILVESILENFWVEIARAFCLVMIIEGIVPFLWPNRWRNMLETVANTDDRTMRVAGLVAMLIGVFLLYLL